MCIQRTSLHCNTNNNSYTTNPLNSCSLSNKHLENAWIFFWCVFRAFALKSVFVYSRGNCQAKFVTLWLQTSGCGSQPGSSTNSSQGRGRYTSGANGPFIQNVLNVIRSCQQIVETLPRSLHSFVDNLKQILLCSPKPSDLLSVSLKELSRHGLR